MPIDPTIALNANRPVAPPFNMLTQIGQTAQTANALMGLQQIRSQKAVGQAYQQATDPTTGVVDPQRAQALIAANPQAAFGAQAAATSGQALQQAQQNRSIQGQAHVNQTLTSLAVLPDSQLNGQTVQSSLDALRQAGSISAQDEQAALSGMPPQGSDPTAYRQFLMQHTVANLGGPEAVQQVYGTAGTQDQGNTLNPIVRASPMMGGAVKQAPGAVGKGFAPTLVSNGGATAIPLLNGQPAGAGITNTTDPTTNAQLIDIPDPAHPGATIKVPRSSLPGASGAPLNAQPGWANGAYRPAGTASAASVTPVSAASVPAAAAPATAVPSGAALPAGAIPGSADPNVVAQNSADVAAYQQAKAGVPTAVTDTQTLGHALDALKVLQNDSLGTGIGSDAAHKMYAYATTLGLATPGMQDSAAQYELAKKNLTRYAASQGTAAHTDMGLSTASASNASVDSVGNQAAQTVVKQEIGKRNQAIAQVNEQTDPTGIGYSAHASQFSQNTDPRAFAFDSYTPQEQQQIIGGLKPGTPARAKFLNSLVLAKKYGMINPPAPASATPAQASASP